MNKSKNNDADPKTLPTLLGYAAAAFLFVAFFTIPDLLSRLVYGGAAAVICALAVAFFLGRPAVRRSPPHIQKLIARLVCFGVIVTTHLLVYLYALRQMSQMRN